MTQAPDPVRVDAVRERVQRWTATLLVAVLPWLIAPGMIQPDTKSDLIISPGRYLGRALWAWNDHTGIGELQNQAYGYLWPMGSLFLAGDAVGMPAWVTQRVWWMLLLVVSFVGAERVARRLAGLTTVPALLVGMVFALSPRVLTVLSEISVEVWPQALAPWLLLAAARAVAPGAGPAHRRRAAVVTGLLAASLGGVNATVSLVALVPAAAWLVLAPRGRAKGRALLWWCAGAALGSAWWLGPLVVLGRYAYPFLDHIELASTTTAVASVTNVLRGANHWIAYILTSGDHPTWQSGWLLAQSVTGILATTTIAGLGLAGLVRRRAAASAEEDGEGRHLTRWGITLVLLGVVAMAIGRSGASSGPFAPLVQDLLDGPLAPFRNVHKADLLVRLPVALGVGLVAHWATRVERGAGPVVRQVVVTTTVLALVGSLAPLWASRVGDAWATNGVPRAWRDVATEVDDLASADGGTTLVLPGARTADFTWGRVTDEPLSALAESPVLSRAAAPLGHPAATRVLDHLDEMTATGRSQPELAAGLRRMGVSRVVVRGGLDPDVGAVDSEQVAETLAASPGITLVSSVGDGPDRISVWRLDESAVPATTVPTSGVVPVAASPEAWFALVASGLLDPDAVTTLADGADAEVRTDTLRWQPLNSGRPPARGHGPTVAGDDPSPSVVGTRDLEPGGATTGRTVRFWSGVDGISVGSSAADPFASAWRSAGSGPAAMVDGDPRTAWVSGDGELSQTITLDLPAGSRPDAVVVHEAWGGDLATLTSVEVDGSDGIKPEGTMTWRVPLDGRERRSITIELTGTHDPATTTQAPVGVREVELEGGPGASSGLEVPSGPGPVLLTRDPRGGSDLALGEDPADLVRRVGPLPRTTVAASVRVRPDASGQETAAAPWSLTGSTPPDESESSAGLTSWPVAALDGDPATRWRPSAGAAAPVLALDLGAAAEISTITLDREAGPVTVATDGGRYVLPTGRTLTIPTQRTRTLSLTFTRPPGRADWTAPEVSLAGGPALSEQVTLACNEAGQVGRDDGRIGLSLTAARRSLVRGEPVPATPCGELPDGDGSITAAAAGGLVPERVTLTPVGWTRTEVAPSRTVSAQRAHTGSWTLDVGAGDESVLVLHQGANGGWRATDPDGRELEPVTVDGWRQGFVLPEGAATRVEVDFVPNAQQRAALAVGAALVVFLLLWGFVELLLRRRGTDEEPPEVSGGAPEPVVAQPGSCETVSGSASPVWVVRVLGVACGAVVGLLVAGWAGALAGAVGALVPVRGRALVVSVVLVGAGVALTVLGVAERQSAGAHASQLLGALTLGVLAAALVRPWSGVPDRGPDAPAASTTGDPDPR